MELYHGTSTTHLSNLIHNSLKQDTWLTSKLHHAFKLAERTSLRDGGEPIVVVFEIPNESVKRKEGRDIPTYQVNKGEYGIVKYIRYEILETKGEKDEN